MFHKVIAFVLVDDKDKKSRFFKKIFLLANISIDIAFEILFHILNNIQIDYNNEELMWKLYIS